MVRPQQPRGASLAPSALAALGVLLLARAAQAAEEHGGGHDLVLFPQLVELVPLLVLFLLLVPLVNALLFKPVFHILDAREERIAGARRRAANLDQDAARVVERYRQAVAEVRSEVEAERKASLEAARRDHGERIASERAEAERQLEAARAELDGALVGARASLRSEVELLAREAATRVLGRSLS